MTADLTHPYQQGRHGATRRAPAGLTAAGRRDWFRRYDDGARSGQVMRRWIARLSPTCSAPELVAEWHRNRRLMGITSDKVCSIVG